MAMDALILEQADKMQGRSFLLAIIDGGEKGLILEELTRLDRLVDAHHGLEDYPAAADRDVADFGISLVAGGQADGRAAAMQEAVRIILPIEIVILDVGLSDDISGLIGPVAPAVADDENDGIFCLHIIVQILNDIL